MLGKDGRLYDSDFDFDGDGELDGYESAVMDDVIFGDGADSLCGVRRAGICRFYG